MVYIILSSGGGGGGSVRGRARNPKLAGGHANAAVLGCILLHSGVALGAVSAHRHSDPTVRVEACEAHPLGPTGPRKREGRGDCRV